MSMDWMTKIIINMVPANLWIDYRRDVTYDLNK